MTFLDLSAPTAWLGELSLYPDLSFPVQVFIRAAYGWLLLATLALNIPNWRWFFIDERWGGYSKHSRLVGFTENPYSSTVICGVWLGLAALLIAGKWTVWAVLVNVLLCHHFFIRMRWNSLLRGMGAPGFIATWLGAAVFLLEYTAAYAIELRPLALLVVQVDLAIIMFSAGVSKIASGYPRNEGMELGLVNPMWGYWWKAYSKLPADHWLLWTLNQLAWGVELLAAILMVIPQTRFVGGMMILLTFVFILTHIRLGFLCEMVVVCGMLFFHPGSMGDLAVRAVVSEPSQAVSAAPAILNFLLGAALWLYLLLRPLAFLGLSYNYFLRKRLWSPLQSGLEAYSNFFGIILWRVFTVDVVNFYVDIRSRNAAAAESPSLARWDSPLDRRYNHVAEAIAVATVFTTLKYYGNQPELFKERLLRYARTLRIARDARPIFRYIEIDKASGRFRYVPRAEYTVDLAAGTVAERSVGEKESGPPRIEGKVAYEGARPGSYAPRR